MTDTLLLNRIGRKGVPVFGLVTSADILLIEWWKGLFSDILVGLSRCKICSVLRDDIVTIWNMNDPEKVSVVALLCSPKLNMVSQHLRSPNFLSLATVLVQDLHDKTKYFYSLSET
jgi:hypothetical protein